MSLHNNFNNGYPKTGIYIFVLYIIGINTQMLTKRSTTELLQHENSTILKTILKNTYCQSVEQQIFDMYWHF